MQPLQHPLQAGALTHVAALTMFFVHPQHVWERKLMQKEMEWEIERGKAEAKRSEEIETQKVMYHALVCLFHAGPAVSSLHLPFMVMRLGRADFIALDAFFGGRNTPLSCGESWRRKRNSS